MRLVLTALMWAALLGGLSLFVDRGPAPEPPPLAPRAAGFEYQTYSLEVTLSFDPAPDAFALRAGDDQPPAAFLVRLHGREILRMEEGPKAGRPVRLEAPPGLGPGLNEFFVQAGPPAEAEGKAGAVRLRLVRKGIVIAETTLWADDGKPAAGIFRVDLPESGPGGGGHD